MKWYEKWSIWIKSARVTYDGQSESDFLEFLERFSMSRIMNFGIVKKNPSFADKFLKSAHQMGNVTLNPRKIGFLLSGSYYDVVRAGWISDILMNERASDMAEKSVAFYELVVAEAKAAGVPVLEQMPNTAKTNIIVKGE